MALPMRVPRGRKYTSPVPRAGGFGFRNMRRRAGGRSQAPGLLRAGGLGLVVGLGALVVAADGVAARALDGVQRLVHRAQELVAVLDLGVPAGDPDRKRDLERLGG